MSATFHTYSDNTKFVYIIIILALLLIVITTIAPIGLSATTIVVGKLIALLLVGYALTKNCLETNKLIKNMPDIFRDQKLSGIRNNALLSYTLCVSMLALFLYVFYTLFF